MSDHDMTGPAEVGRVARSAAGEDGETVGDGGKDGDGGKIGDGEAEDGDGESTVRTATNDAALAVQAVGLAKSYGDAPALLPLDLEVAAGERVSLIGHNGSGKTTLIRMLAGMLEPTEGSATIGGHPVGSPAARAALSYLADQPVFYDDLSVWQHVEYVARLHHTDDWEDHAVGLLDAVGLRHRADDLPVTFSRGLKQKASIVLAFARPFDVMLIDEPFVGLDRAGREALLELIDSAHADGATVVVATHELASVAASQRLIALSDGAVVFDGPPAAADIDRLAAGATPERADGATRDGAEEAIPGPADFVVGADIGADDSDAGGASP